MHSNDGIDQATPVDTVAALLATAIMRRQARTLGITTNLWPETSSSDLTSSASRAIHVTPGPRGEKEVRR